MPKTTTINVADAKRHFNVLIGATALIREYTVVTGNVRHIPIPEKRRDSLLAFTRMGWDS
jgi:predicted nucleic acid-binding protein